MIFFSFAKYQTYVTNKMSFIFLLLLSSQPRCLLTQLYCVEWHTFENKPEGEKKGKREYKDDLADRRDRSVNLKTSNRLAVLRTYRNRKDSIYKRNILSAHTFSAAFPELAFKYLSLDSLAQLSVIITVNRFHNDKVLLAKSWRSRSAPLTQQGDDYLSLA